MSAIQDPTPKFECVLKCRDTKNLFRFPREESSRKTWLDRIGLHTMPRNIAFTRICGNHFSESMFSEGGKRLTSCAVPDINIPGKLIDTTPDGRFQVIKPRPIRYHVNLAEVPHFVSHDEIITNKSSRCFLKCKDAESTYGFPKDKASLSLWLNQLGITEMPSRSISARICRNHFSQRMINGRLLTTSAIPDINLPGETIFRPDYEAEQARVVTNSEPAILGEDGELIRNGVHLIGSAADYPPIMFEVPQTEILINTIENINNAINLTTNKEGILHVFQPGIERKSDGINDETVVSLPEDVIDADSECVLKCPHGERLFRFPNSEANRQKWLKQIGLTHCFFNTKICNRHFSDRMFISSKKRLVKLAYPDINIPAPKQPRIDDDSRVLKDYSIILQENHACDVIEIPEHICVLTVYKAHTEVDTVINGSKYVRHKVDENIPKRDRQLQVNMADLIRTVNVAIPADDVDEFYIEEETEANIHEVDWVKMFKSHVFDSKADMYECLICGEISVGQDCNFKHSNMHKESRSQCFQCGMLFPSQYKLKMHEKDMHLNHLRKALRCPKMYCKKAFRSEKQLYKHVDQHTRNRDHKCSNCLRLFHSSLKLNCHQLSCRNGWALKYRRMTRHCLRANVKRSKYTVRCK